jgi:DNA-directed RNA polymerase subunit L
MTTPTDMNFNLKITPNDAKNSNSLAFTLSGVNVSIANAIRRTILSDIPILVFRTSPQEKNKCNIIANTTRFNNEIIKQRLSCIPIHIQDIKNFPLKNYILEVNVENKTDTIMYVTTEDFEIKDLTTSKYLPKEKVREIFPPCNETGYFIDFVRLRPKLTDELPGEKIHLTCEFDIGNANEDGMFNVASTSVYGNSIDTALQDAELAKKIQQWKDEGKTEKEIDFESKNWKLLDGKRFFLKDSFDFTIESVGIFDNHQLVDLACKILIGKYQELNELLEKDELEIRNSDNTLKNAYDIVLMNEDYTIGKPLEYFLYTSYFEANVLSFCGFKKYHPHDDYSIIRIAYNNAVEKSTVKGHLQMCITNCIEIFTKIVKEFSRLYNK